MQAVIRVLTAKESRALDDEAERRMVCPSWLMEVAGAKAAQYLSTRLDQGADRVVVAVGSGRNGGDGLVAARYLARFLPVEVVLLQGVPHFDGASRLLDAARAYGVHITDPEEFGLALSRATVVIDAILGTGIQAPLRPWARRAIDTINDSGRPCYALDIPSGVDADTGQIDGSAVRAKATITFGGSKWGHWCYPGTSHRGDLVVADIGLSEPDSASAGVLSADQVRGWIRPLAVDGHKYQRGRLVVVGGSQGMPGAPLMAAEAALRMGVGLVHLMVPRSLLNRISPSSAMLVSGSEEDDQGRLRWGDEHWAALEKADAVVIGPGLGEVSPSGWFKELLGLGKPMVVDADGLALLKGVLGQHNLEHVVLTPHQGEMARLLGVSASHVDQDRVGAFTRLQEQFGATVVLKGPHSIAGRPDHLYVNQSGIPELATAGSGDVLSGIIGGLLASGLAPWQAAAAGVYIHGRAGQEAEAVHGQSLIAPDLIQALAGDWQHWLSDRREEDPQWF